MFPQDGNHAHNVLSSLNQQRTLGRFCDAALDVGDGVVYMAHRNVLACCSDLFREDDYSSREVCLTDCPNDGLELLLNFVYTGELKLDALNLDKVRCAAVCLCVPQALALCQSFSESLREPVPVKRKRGRPKKARETIKPYSIHEETGAYVPSAESSTSSPHDNVTAKVTTITRSGRKVKCPRRLPGETCEPPARDNGSTGAPHVSPVDMSNQCAPIDRTPVHSSREKQMSEVQMDFTDALGHDLHQDTEDRGGGFDAVDEDSDEEYVPVAEPSAVPVSSGRSKVPQKAEKKENGEATEADPKKPSVQCPVCNKTFRSKYYLKVHNRRHTGEKPFVCSKCGKRYFRKENLLEHEARNCSKVVTFSCTICPSVFKRKQEFRLHMISHTGDMPNKCTSCPEQFMQKRDLTMHLIKIHGFAKPHACSQCTKGFLTRTELRVHEAAKHRGEKPFVCEECAHRASSRNGLQMHIKAIHRNERPFVCSYCGHAFTQKTNLIMHLRVHTGERPYQCHLCGKTFRTHASLDKHNRTHTGERPFGCEFCEHRFTEKGPLVRHIASRHQEGRPHCCHICGKTFKALEQLRVHLRRHKGVRKFECVDCGYKFTRQAHLRRHSLIHKRMENYNPKQRKLRNLIIESQGEGEATQSPKALTLSASHDPLPLALPIQEDPSQQLSLPDPGLDPNSFVPVVLMEDGVSIKALVVGDGCPGNIVPVSGVLQQTQLEPGSYTTVVLERIGENLAVPERELKET
ncbi:telomere zinc finger-associated protein isoform X2 [Gadus morhua]|nr:telomere zinc finger-associated protein isoform X2 [Gadus morhua]